MIVETRAIKWYISDCEWENKFPLEDFELKLSSARVQRREQFSQNVINHPAFHYQLLDGLSSVSRNSKREKCRWNKIIKVSTTV